MAKSKRIEFDLPEGFTIPDGLSEGKEFESLATVKLKKDGSACLVALDGYRMPGYKEEDESAPDSDDKRSYAQAASDGMMGQKMMEGGY